jgi:TolB protein
MGVGRVNRNAQLSVTITPPSFLMSKFFQFFTLAVALVASPLFAQRELGDVVITADLKTIPVIVTGSTPELNTLANLAFSAHGRYRRVTSGGTYDIKFTAVSGNQVQVTVTKGGAPVLSQIAQGTSTRNALLRAADLAVKATSGLKGFFASRLAFISERTGKQEIYTGDLFFGEVKQITRDNAQAMSPRWSPDGGKVIYTSFYKSGFPDIFLLDLNSLQRTTFVSLKGTNMGARFSPTGGQVAMVLTGEGNPEIYVSNAQGRGIARRTRTSAVEASPCFSPDGTRLVFTSDSAGGPQLYTMSAMGGAPQRLVTNLSRYCAEPDWSKGDVNKIAFTAGMGKGFQIGVLDLSGKTPTKIVSKAAMDAVEPSWLGDGRHLIYTARAANSRSLYILDTETGKSTRISPSAMGQTSQASVWGP